MNRQEAARRRERGVPAEGGTGRLVRLRGVRSLGLLALFASSIAAPIAWSPAAAGVSASRPVVGVAPAPTAAQTTLIPSRLVSPSGVAVDGSGNVYATDEQNQVVEVPKGGAQIALGFTGVSFPHGVAVDAAGDVYIADTNNNRVLELTRAGTQVTVGFTGLTGPEGVAVDGVGDVFVADTFANRVVELPKGGTQVTLGFAGLNRPSSVAVDGSGDTYVADTNDNRIVELPTGGSQVTLGFNGLNRPGGVAVDGAGTMYVADSLANRVVELPKGGTQLTAALTGLRDPQAIAVDGSGDVFVVNQSPGPVVELTSDGRQVIVGIVGLFQPRKTAVDASGDVYVADTSNLRVVELTSGGVLLTLALTGLRGPTGVAVDGRGNVYVADVDFGPGTGRVVELPKGGTQVTLGFTGLATPQEVAVDGSGDVYVADTGNNRIVELPLGGAQVTLGFSGLFEPGGVAVDGSGNVYVADTNNRRVVEVPNGGAQVTLGFTGLREPGGVAVDGSQNVYVADTDNNRVVELPRGGTQATLGMSGLSWPTGMAVDRFGNVYVANDQKGGLVEWSPVPTVPLAPAIGAVTGGRGRAGVSWSAPAWSGASPTTGYVVTPYIGTTAQRALPFGSTATAQTVTGLANGTTYTFKVAATNSVGTGPRSDASALVLPPFASPSAFVQRQYQDLLGRSATSDEVTAEIHALDAGAAPGAFIGALRRSGDASANVDPVTRLYFAYFLRIPDQGGLAYWIGRKRAGTSLHTISDGFAGSPEFKKRYGSLANRQFVEFVYRNVLSRPGDTAGVDYWTGQLDTRAKTRGQVMIGFSESQEHVAKEVPSVDVAVTWIDMLGASPDATSFNTWVTNLTTGGDTVADLAANLLADPRYAGRVG